MATVEAAPMELNISVTPVSSFALVSKYSEPAPIRKTVDKKICTARPAETKKTLYGLHSVRKGGANKKTDSGLRAGTSKLVY